MRVTAAIAFQGPYVRIKHFPADALQQAKQFISQYIGDYFEFLQKDFVENKKPQ